MSMNNQVSFPLKQDERPQHWYNILADMPEPMPPPLHPGTKKPVSLEDMVRIFPENLVRQEMSPERYIEIPGPVQEVYALYRPTPLTRAVRLERELQDPGAHLLQERERLAGRQPQAQHGHCAGLLQQAGRREAAGHGNRRGAVGLGAGPGLRHFRP